MPAKPNPRRAHGLLERFRVGIKSAAYKLAWRIRLRLSAAAGRTGAGHSGMLLWAILIGILGGLGSAAFRAVNLQLTWLFTGQSRDIVMIAESLSPIERVWIPTIGGALAGFALMLGARLLPGQRPLEYLEAIRLGDGVMRVRATLLPLLSSLLSVSAGASIGREGGMVQLSAMLGSVLGRCLSVSQPKLKLMVACGGAAGLASGFNTPLAGALFIAEVVLQSIAIEALGPLIVSAITATLVIRHWIGIQPIFASAVLNAPVTIDLPRVFELGLVAGLAAPVFLLSLELSRSVFRRLRFSLPTSLALGGLMVGLISLVRPEVWGNGHGVVEALFREPATFDFVLSILLMKFLATVIASGSGAVGGVFTPTLLIGAALGWLFESLFPATGVHSTGVLVTYAALGAGAFLAATTHAPVLAILMVFEMTLDANLLFPLIIACLTSRYLSAALRSKSIYAESLGPHRPLLPMYLAHVSDLMTKPKAVMDLSTSLDELRAAFCTTTASRIWITDRHGLLLGAIAPAAITQGHWESEALAQSLMQPQPPSIQPMQPLGEALRLLIESGSEELPVVDGRGRLIGEVSRSDVLLSLT
ncbi:ClcB-like voltage-gated chloride channel protein [Methyloterricola oryzae]|uniref:ClcB-like voltage-gated chloride channel protein n=1 Tax=Methyloterricola oryzae TaxID=1495050 RepID=UPI0009E36004|nr:ClcB-like voltage-gated chloride channel protein [Methyloterricola oryzae]